MKRKTKTRQRGVGGTTGREAPPTIEHAPPAPMAPDELETIGLARHGARWISPLAREVGVSFKQMWAYRHGRAAIPRPTAGYIRHLLWLRTPQL